MPTKVDEKAMVEATDARLQDLEAQQRAVLSALEAACRAANAQEMIALRRKRAALAEERKEVEAWSLAAQHRQVQAEIDELDRQIAAAQQEQTKIEASVRQSQENIARSNVGMNQHFLTGRSGVLFASGSGPGLAEYGERQQLARSNAARLHGLQTQRRNVAQELTRVDAALRAWFDEQ